MEPTQTLLVRRDRIKFALPKLEQAVPESAPRLSMLFSKPIEGAEHDAANGIAIRLRDRGVGVLGDDDLRHRRHLAERSSASTRTCLHRMRRTRTSLPACG